MMMETRTAGPVRIKGRNKGNIPGHVAGSSVMVNGPGRIWVGIRVRLTILRIAIKCYGSVLKAISAARRLVKFDQTIYGKKPTRRCVKINGKYYFGIYIPPFPSLAFNQFVQTELNHVQHHRQPVDRFRSILLAITNKCPLKCEHCFEWNNLNKNETFTNDELVKLVRKIQQAGCSQFFFTGGEPLVKMEELVELVQSSGSSSSYWILTSGFNLTLQNAIRLKQAGVTGVIISLDHFDPVIHNFFRGSEHAYQYAIKAAHCAREAGLVTAFSICVTRSFVTRPNLLRYAQLAKDCGVAFVQLLEPKPVGHYLDKTVGLSREHIDILEDFYLSVNYEKKYRSLPLFIYHEFYQRRLGCLSGGNRMLYIDSAGYINACPFCQTRSYHAGDIISGCLHVNDLQIGGCPAFTNRQQLKDELGAISK